MRTIAWIFGFGLLGVVMYAVQPFGGSRRWPRATVLMPGSRYYFSVAVPVASPAGFNTARAILTSLGTDDHVVIYEHGTAPMVDVPGEWYTDSRDPYRVVGMMTFRGASPYATHATDTTIKFWGPA